MKMKKLFLPVFAIFLACFACKSSTRVEGGLSFETVSMQKKEKIASASLEWKGKAEIMTATKDGDDEEEAARLNLMIAGMILEGETDVETALEKRQNEYIEAFKASASEPDNGNFSLTWKSGLSGKVVSVSGQFISYVVSDHSIISGGKKNVVENYSVFDRQEGQGVPLSYFIPEENNAELEKIIRETLVQDKEFSSYEALRNDFLKDDLEITQNFYADDLGIHFVYNAGEITDEAEGIINILVRWDVLKTLLNPGIM